jgi:hypothetical protein
MIEEFNNLILPNIWQVLSVNIAVVFGVSILEEVKTPEIRRIAGSLPFELSGGHGSGRPLPWSWPPPLAAYRR